MLLPSLVTIHHPTTYELTPEDIFESSLSGIFINDLYVHTIPISRTPSHLPLAKRK